MKDHIGPCRAILPQRLDWNWFYSHVIYTHCIERKCSWQLSPISAPRGGQSVWRRRGSILIHSILTSQEEQQGGQAYPCDLQQLNSKTYSGRMVAGLPLATGSPHLGLVLHQLSYSFLQIEADARKPINGWNDFLSFSSRPLGKSVSCVWLADSRRNPTDPFVPSCPLLRGLKATMDTGSHMCHYLVSS